MLLLKGLVMPSRPIFLSRAARRNYRLAQAAAVLVFGAGIACFVVFVYLGIKAAFS